MSTLLKKFAFSFLASLVVLFSFAPFFEVKAASPWYNPNFFDFYDKVYNENTSPGGDIFGERYTAAQVSWVFYSVISWAVNVPETLVEMLLGVTVPSPNPTVCALGLIHGSLDYSTCVQAVGNFVGAVSNKLSSFFSIGSTPGNSSIASNQNLWTDVFSTQRPISLIGYTAGIFEKLNPVTEVHAQASTGGFGLSRLLVISDMWKVARNAAYSILIVAVIAIAFMIMFRVKISPQAAITIQSAIPRIVMTLILITFSLAIAGLMIDLMYVVIGFIATLLPGLTSLSYNPTDAYNFMVGHAHHDAFFEIGAKFLFYLIFYLVTSIVVVLSAFLTLNATSIIFGVLMFLFTIILFFILLINWFKVMFMLIKNTALIYVAVIVGPLQLMMGVFPGPLGQGAFSGWLKGLVSKLAVFPVAGLLLFFSFKFLGMAFMLAIQGAENAYGLASFAGACAKGWGAGICGYFFGSQAANGASFWGPPLLGDAGAITGLVFLLISVGAIMMIPKVADMVEGFLSGKPIGYGAAIGESLGPAVGVGKYAQGAAIGAGVGQLKKLADEGKIKNRIIKSIISEAARQQHLDEKSQIKTPEEINRNS